MKDWRIAFAAAAGTAALIGTAHAITDTAFTYSTPKLGFFSIHPRALSPNTNTMGYIISTNQAQISGTSTGCFATAVNLPQGAKVETIVTWYASGAGQTPTVGLFRQHQSDGVSDGYNVALLSNTGARVQNTINVAGNLTIDNSAYSYEFHFCPASSDNIFYTARIKYTYTNAGD